MLESYDISGIERDLELLSALISSNNFPDY